MRLIERLHNPESKFTIRQIVKWLWRVMKGNRTQAVFNATIGLLGVVCSLLMVWAMQHTIDMATGVSEGSLYWGVALMGFVIVCEFEHKYNKILGFPIPSLENSPSNKWGTGIPQEYSPCKFNLTIIKVTSGLYVKGASGH